MRTMYIFWSALLSALLAQFLKPVISFLFISHKWDWSLAHAAGGFPSSHSAMVAALSLSVGLQEIEQMRKHVDELLERALEEGKALMLECAPEQAVTKHIAEKMGFSYMGRLDGRAIYKYAAP